MNLIYEATYNLLAVLKQKSVSSMEHSEFTILYCFWNECEFLKDVAKSLDRSIEMRYHLFPIVFLVRWEWKMLEKARAHTNAKEREREQEVPH